MTVQIELTIQDINIINMALDNFQIKGSSAVMYAHTLLKLRTAAEKLDEAIRKQQIVEKT